LQRIGSPPLPPLTAYKTAPGTKKRNSNPPLADPADPGPTVAVIPTLPQPTPPKPDPNPFDPIGIDVGSLRLFPYVEADTGYDSNPNQQSTGVMGSYYAHGETGLKLQSDWSQHNFTAVLRGGYYDYFDVPTANRPDVASTITGRIDVTRQTQINLVNTFTLQTQTPGSAILAIPGSVFITNRPLIATLGQSAGLTQQFNRLSIGLRGTFDRYVFGDATQSDGTILLLSQDDYNDYGLVGRASYELTPGVIPFFEITGDSRRYDHYYDVYGFARSSNGIAGKLGSTFEFSRLLTGEIAAASTVLSETTLAYASGAVSRLTSLEVSHALMRGLKLTATATYQNYFYEGQPLTEQLYSGALKVDYNLTRSVVIMGSFTHQRFLSTSPGENYTENIFLLGLRLQD
jgi:hypothetical protein